MNEAFAERDTQESQSVEQLFGVAPEQKAAEPAAADTPEPALPQFSDQTADKPLPVGNPNDLTEIELKEGSTYLISDFVPPAQTDGNALPKELSGLQSASANPDDALNQPLDEASQTSDVQEWWLPPSRRKNRLNRLRTRRKTLRCPRLFGKHHQNQTRRDAGHQNRADGAGTGPVRPPAP